MSLVFKLPTPPPKAPEQPLPPAPEVPPETEDTSPGPNLQDVLSEEDAETAYAERRARIKEQIGEMPEVRTQSNKDLLAVLKDGVVVEFHAQRWRGGYRLEREETGYDADLDAFVEKYLSTGRKFLLPKEYRGALNSCEAATRGALYKAGFRTAHGWFVPTSRFKLFKTPFERNRGRYLEVIEAVASRLDIIKTQVANDYRKLAPTVWKSARETWTEQGSQAPGAFKLQPEPTPLFVDTFIERLLTKIPSADEIRDMAVFSYSLAIIYSPDAELATEFASSDAELNQELKTQLHQKKRKLIDDFLLAARAGLAESISKLLNDWTSRYLGGGKKPLNKRALNSILKALSDVKDLNVINVEAVTNAIEEMETAINGKLGAQNEMSPGELKKHIARAAQTVQKMTEADLKAGSVYAKVGL